MAAVGGQSGAEWRRHYETDGRILYCGGLCHAGDLPQGGGGQAHDADWGGGHCGRCHQTGGISRSAYYKYKDAVRPFNDMLHGRIVTFQTMLKDEPGILSGLLNVFAGTGVNILTINQNIPVNGCAVVTITAETSALQRSLEDMLNAAAGSPGVLKCEILAG